MKKLIYITIALLLSACANNQYGYSKSLSSGISIPVETSTTSGNLYQSIYASQYGVSLSTGAYLRNLLGIGEHININVNW